MATEIKYTAANNLHHAKEPKQATVGSVGHDLFAAEQKLIQPGTVAPITLELNLEIPEGFFGKIYPRFGSLKKNFASCDAGLIDQDYRGTVMVLMTNNSTFPFLVNIGDRIAQTVFQIFQKVDKLCCTACGGGGFGLTGV